MNIHRELHSKRTLTETDFALWVSLFVETVDEMFSGEKAERAKQIAMSIAGNMQVAMPE